MDLDSLPLTASLAATLASSPLHADTPDVLAQNGWVRHGEAAEALGLSRATLQRLRSSGKLPYAKLGRGVFYRTSDICALLESAVVREHEPGPSARPRS